MNLPLSSALNDSMISFALGTGKSAKQRYSEKPLREIIDALQKLPKEIAAKQQKKVLKKAAVVGRIALESQVGKLGRVTGNLAASIMLKSKVYSSNIVGIPVSIFVVGFRRATGGKNPASLGFHSHLVEFGTQNRRFPGKSVAGKKKRFVVDGRIVTRRDRVKQETIQTILSSFNTRRRMQGESAQYPFDFFTNAGSVAPMPALRPLGKAFSASQGQMAQIIESGMRSALQAGLRANVRNAKKFLGG